MHRFFINPNQISGKRVIFPPDIIHQIMHVLRMAEGDLVEVLINDGFACLTQLHLDPVRQKVFGEIKEKYRILSEPRVDSQLYFALSNREKVEWILQKGTEIGVSSFCPVISSRSIVRDIKLPGKKRIRWKRIIREAAEQSNRGKIPILNDPI